MDIDSQDYRFQFDRRSTGDSDSQQGIWSPITGPFGFRFLGTGIWQGGRPELTVDFKAVCDATLMVRNGSGETITDIANRFGVSRGWIHKWVYPVSVSKPQ